MIRAASDLCRSVLGERTGDDDQRVKTIIVDREPGVDIPIIHRRADGSHEVVVEVGRKRPDVMGKDILVVAIWLEQLLVCERMARAGIAAVFAV